MCLRKYDMEDDLRGNWQAAMDTSSERLTKCLVRDETEERTSHDDPGTLGALKA